MSNDAWLKTYYSKEWLEKLKPVVYLDNGKEHAVVRVMGSSSTGYALVKKTGKHGATPQKHLHEGVLRSTDVARMVKELEKADS